MTKSLQQIDEILTASGQICEVEHVNVNGAVVRSWKHVPGSIAAIVEHTRSFGDRDFIVYGEERLTYAQHFRQVAQVAHWLRDVSGIEKGDRVAIVMRNYPEWSVAFFAAAAMGAVVVPLNAWWTSKELEYGLIDSGARLVFADSERLSRLEEIASSFPLAQVVVVRCDNVPPGAISFGALITGGTPDIELPAVAIEPDDPATIFYTSGTTGRPKGALGSHRNFCSVVGSIIYAGARTLLRMGGTLEDLPAMQQFPQAALLTVPLFHVTGCHGSLLSMFYSGGKLVMLYKWDPEAALDAIERERITLFGGVPNMVWQLLTLPGAENRDLSSLLNIGYGGAPAPADLANAIKARVPTTSATNGWGITETSSAITGISGQDYLERPQSVGRPHPICEVKVVNASGDTLPPGERGELLVRGSNVTLGYWNNPEATASAYTDGWFHTGDIGKLDEEGFIYLLDRLKEMIIRGGENVYCAEVQSALVSHPDVDDACVFGVPHDLLGEEVAAVIQLRAGARPDEHEILKHAAQQLAKFKVPTHLWIHPEPLPVGATGKVLKKELKALYTEILKGTRQ